MGTRRETAPGCGLPGRRAGFQQMAVCRRRVAGVDFGLPGLAARALQTRALVRAPVTLYRHGLGWVLGGRVLMLEHTGRRSGRARFACLEVADRPGPDRMVIRQRIRRARPVVPEPAG